MLRIGALLSMRNPNVDPNQLTAETGWLRRLAHSLLQDAAQADDAVQDTLRLALTAPPNAATGTPAFRKWLSTTLRGRAANQSRSLRRRRDHEKRAAQDREHESRSAADLVAAAESSERLVQAVMGLGKAHRSVLLLRDFEGHSNVVIAEQLGVSSDAVRNRIARARRKLAEALDEESGGDRSIWIASLLPLVRNSPPAPALASLKVAALSLMTLKSVAIVSVSALALWIIASLLGANPLVGPAPVEARTPASAEGLISGDRSSGHRGAATWRPSTATLRGSRFSRRPKTLRAPQPTSEATAMSMARENAPIFAMVTARSRWTPLSPSSAAPANALATSSFSHRSRKQKAIDGMSSSHTPRLRAGKDLGAAIAVSTASSAELAAMNKASHPRWAP